MPMNGQLYSTFFIFGFGSELFLKIDQRDKTLQISKNNKKKYIEKMTECMQFLLTKKWGYVGRGQSKIINKSTIL